MKKCSIKALLITAGLLVFQTISYGVPRLQIKLNGPDELQYTFERASIQAPLSKQDNLDALEESQRGQIRTWTALRNNDRVNSTDIELQTSSLPSNAENSMVLNFFENNKTITQQPKRLILKKGDQEITVGDYKINMHVEDKDPGPHVQYYVTLTARKNS